MAAVAVVVTAGMFLASTASAATAANRADGTRTDVALERAHAHNDYEHDRPLYDALSNGFKRVEAALPFRRGSQDGYVAVTV